MEPTACYKKYDFLPALMQLKQRYKNRLLLCASAKLSFPAAIIADFYMMPDNTAVVELALPGLLGAFSPLPDYFLECARDSVVMRDFLNIFNRRIYELWYLSQLRTKSDNDLATIFYGGVANGGGVRKIIANYFPAVPVVIKHLVPCWIDMKSGWVLGADTVLGGRVLTTSRKIVVIFNAIVAYEKLRDFKEQLRCYLGGVVAVEIQLAPWLMRKLQPCLGEFKLS